MEMLKQSEHPWGPALAAWKPDSGRTWLPSGWICDERVEFVSVHPLYPPWVDTEIQAKAHGHGTSCGHGYSWTGFRPSPTLSSYETWLLVCEIGEARTHSTG